MTVTIQINTPEDFKLMEPLLRLIREQLFKYQLTHLQNQKIP